MSSVVKLAYCRPAAGRCIDQDQKAPCCHAAKLHYPLPIAHFELNLRAEPVIKVGIMGVGVKLLTSPSFELEQGK